MTEILHPFGNCLRVLYVYIYCGMLGFISVILLCAFYLSRWGSGMHAGVYVWRLDDNMEEELLLFFNHVDPRD